MSSRIQHFKAKLSRYSSHESNSSRIDPRAVGIKQSQSCPAVEIAKSTDSELRTTSKRLASMASALLYGSPSTTRSLLGLATAAALCLVWTLWLMLLTAAPNTVVNHIMNTEAFDDGSFWRFVDPMPTMLAVGLGGLGIVALSYLYIIARVTVFRHRKFWSWQRKASQKSVVQRHFSIFKKRVSAVAAAPVTAKTSSDEGLEMNRGIARQAAVVVLDLVTADSSCRKLINLALKLIDLGIQCVQLVDIMERGLPTTFIWLIAALIVFNALATALVVITSPRRAGLYALLLDTFFDICIAILFPMTIAVYCTSTFSIDRRVLTINTEVYPPGWFERGASTVSDPFGPEIIRTAFNSLRIFSAFSALARIGTNLALCRRFYQLAARIKDPSKWKSELYPRKFSACFMLLAIAVLVVVFVEESVRTSGIACRPHPECIQNARRWIKLDENGNLSQCPCLTLVDVDTRLKTYDEWLNPRDVTLKVSQLAASGDLQTINVINRQLPVLPDELRRCKNLKHLSLIYTHTEDLPSWTKEFTKLEYLHIETKLGISSRVDMPVDLFDDMASLTFIHFGINDIDRLPSMDGLTNLKSLTIAVFLHLVELPSFQHLESLKRLVLSSLPVLKTVPDLAAIPKLEAFAVSDRGEFCCNGFASDCDLHHSMCQRHLVWGTPPATCLPSNETATAATRSMFSKFSATVCAGRALLPGDLETGPTLEMALQCNGTMYKRCTDPGYSEAMCYNPRLMGITCDHNPFPIEMRRRQIAEGVGDPCDPEVEAWLGCR